MYIRHNSPHFVKNIPQVFKTDPKGIAVRPKNSLNVEVIPRHDRNFIIACPSVAPLVVRVTIKGAKGTKQNRFFLIYSKMVGDTA